MLFIQVPRAKIIEIEKKDRGEAETAPTITIHSSICNYEAWWKL